MLLEGVFSGFFGIASSYRLQQYDKRGKVFFSFVRGRNNKCFFSAFSQLFFCLWWRFVGWVDGMQLAGGPKRNIFSSHYNHRSIRESLSVKAGLQR